LTKLVTTARAARSDRASTTQQAILTAAERLFAEHGVFAVSNRQVSEAAGQGNNAASVITSAPRPTWCGPSNNGTGSPSNVCGRTWSRRP